MPGFGLRVSATGQRSWFGFYRVKVGPQQGKQRRYTLPLSAEAIGLSDARQAARDVMRRVEVGEDPSADKRRVRADLAAARPCERLRTSLLSDTRSQGTDLGGRRRASLRSMSAPSGAISR